MKIGLLGEAPNDTSSVLHIFKKKYPEHDLTYIVLLNNITGGQLDSQKTKRLLRKEYEIESPEVVVFIRDLDGLSNNIHQLELRKEYFRSMNSVVDKCGIFLLHIFEIEALIVSDLATFNRIYNSTLSYEGNPMELINPKEYLKDNCRKYTESHNADIFSQISLEMIENRCSYINVFFGNFEKLLN